MKSVPTAIGGMPIRVTGVPWYRREDFFEIKRLMADGQKLHATWEGWHSAAQDLERRLKQDGHTVVRVPLLPEEFATWCAARGARLDAQARADFAAFAAKDAHPHSH